MTMVDRLMTIGGINALAGRGSSSTGYGDCFAGRLRPASRGDERVPEEVAASPPVLPFDGTGGSAVGTATGSAVGTATGSAVGTATGSAIGTATGPAIGVAKGSMILIWHLPGASDFAFASAFAFPAFASAFAAALAFAFATALFAFAAAALLADAAA